MSRIEPIVWKQPESQKPKWLEIGQVVQLKNGHCVGVIISGCFGAYKVQWADRGISAQRQDDLVAYDMQQILNILQQSLHLQGDA